MGSDAQPRLVSIDFLRGLAMMALVFVHAVLFIVVADEGIDPIELVVGYILGDLGAALFTTIVGISFVLSTRTRSGLTYGATVVAAAIRGGVLIVLSMALSAFVFGTDAALETDILTLIGLASIVIALLRPLPSGALLAVAVGVAAVSPPLREAVGYTDRWGGAFEPLPGLPLEGTLLYPPAYFEPGWDIGAGLLGVLAVGDFPLFPWLAFPLIGMVIGRFITGERVRTARILQALGLMSLVLSAIVVSIALRQPTADSVSGYLTVLSFYPNSISMMLLQAGLVCLLIGVAHQALDGSSPKPWMKWFLLVGRRALTVYALSWIAIGIAVRIASLINPAGGAYANVTTSVGAMLFGLVFLLVLLPILDRWDRAGGVGTLEWAVQGMRGRPRKGGPDPAPVAHASRRSPLGTIAADGAGIAGTLAILTLVLAGIVIVVWLVFISIGALSAL